MEMIRKLSFMGYEDYAVTTDGEVWSIKSKNWLKPRINGSGYLQVALYKGGKRKSFYIHRLVALAFIPNPMNLPQINHKNEDKKDNRLENLEWISTKDNCNYGTRNERLSKKVYCIELDKVFNSVSGAAKELGLLGSSISNCLTGRCKTSGGFHFNYYTNKEMI